FLVRGVVARLARHPGVRRAGTGRVSSFWRGRVRHLARSSVVHHHRREHGHSADERPHAAAHVVRRLEHARHVGLARALDAHLSRGEHRRPFGRAETGARGMKRGTVLIMAGGTGGHIFPALAAARVLRERGFEPVWLGTQRGLEAKLVPPQQIEIEWISVSVLRGKGIGTWFAAPFKLSLALWQSLKVM